MSHRMYNPSLVMLATPLASCTYFVLHIITPLMVESQHKFTFRYHGVNVHFTNPLLGALDQIYGTGVVRPFSIVRMDLTWSKIDKQPEFITCPIMIS